VLAKRFAFHHQLDLALQRLYRAAQHSSVRGRLQQTGLQQSIHGTANRIRLLHELPGLAVFGQDEGSHRTTVPRSFIDLFQTRETVLRPQATVHWRNVRDMPVTQAEQIPANLLPRQRAGADAEVPHAASGSAADRQMHPFALNQQCHWATVQSVRHNAQEVLLSTPYCPDDVPEDLTRTRSLRWNV
jgi:hypothetical protein